MARNDPRVKVIGIGTLTKDPETGIAGETEYAKISVANNRSFKGKEYTDYIVIKIWGKQVEFVKNYLRKGKHIHFEGVWRTDSWEKEGQKKAFTYVDQGNVSFLPGGPVKKEETSTPPPAASQPSMPDFNDIDDDIPF